jgi:hypothetical protein
MPGRSILAPYCAQSRFALPQDLPAVYIPKTYSETQDQNYHSPKANVKE